MRKPFRFGPTRLTMQIVAMLVLLVILTAGAIGLPSIWLIRDQLEQQAWGLVRQGSQTTHTLIESQKSDLNGLAILTAQRPTLIEALQTDDPEQIAAYLAALQRGAGLDLALLCTAAKKPAISAGLPYDQPACQTLGAAGIYRFPGASGAQGWLVASQPIMDRPDTWVVIGREIGAAWIDRLKQQTGLEQVLLLDGRFLAGSFPGGEAAWRQISRSMATGAGQPSQDGGSTGVFEYEQTPYYALRAHWAGSNLETVVSLSVAHIVQAQKRWTWIVGGGIFLVILASSILGAFLARRISAPLERLRDAAYALRKGDLVTPVTAPTGVRELAQVAYALEDARSTLQHTLAALRQEKEWTDHLLESVVEGIITLDRHERITFFSHGAERMTGLSQAQVLGKPIDEVFRLPDEGERFSDHLPPPGGRQTLVTVLGEGRQATLAITGARLAPPQAGRAGIALVLRDVSDEESIRRLLGDFLANITHEFRTPLSALAASIELLLDQLPSLSKAELQELLEALHLGILGLQTLIDNLLEGASIEAGRFRVQPRPVDLVEIAANVIHQMQPLFDKYHLRLVFDWPDDLPLVLADSRRTGQVLVNLLSNAVKMGPPGSAITVSANVADGMVRVWVADQGPGVPPGQRQDIFRRFARPHGEGAHPDHGAGLGLSVVKAIVEAQEGQVGVTDAPQGGAAFWFTVPVAAPGPDAPEKTGGQERESQSR